VDADAGERVEIRRQGRDQRLAFAGAHLADLAVVQRYAANQLNVEMAHVERAFSGFAHHCEGFGQYFFERFTPHPIECGLVRLAAGRVSPFRGRLDLADALGDALPEFIGLRT
jgi:hypothetical protein